MLTGFSCFLATLFFHVLGRVETTARSYPKVDRKSELWLGGRISSQLPTEHSCRQALDDGHKIGERLLRVIEFEPMERQRELVTTQATVEISLLWLYDTDYMVFVFCPFDDDGGRRDRLTIRLDLEARRRQDRHEFDVTPLLQNAATSPATSHADGRLLVACWMLDSDERTMTDGGRRPHLQVGNNLQLAYLVVRVRRTSSLELEEERRSLTVGGGRRPTPNAGLCDESQLAKARRRGRSYCCLRPFNVSFSDINWHWVKTPASVQLYFCQGFCAHPFADGYAVRNRTESLRHMLHQLAAGQRPTPTDGCCTVYEYRKRHFQAYAGRGRTQTVARHDVDHKSCLCQM